MVREPWARAGGGEGGVLHQPSVDHYPHPVNDHPKDTHTHPTTTTTTTTTPSIKITALLHCIERTCF